MNFFFGILVEQISITLSLVFYNVNMKKKSLKEQLQVQLIHGKHNSTNIKIKFVKLLYLEHYLLQSMQFYF